MLLVIDASIAVSYAIRDCDDESSCKHIVHHHRKPLLAFQLASRGGPCKGSCNLIKQRAQSVIPHAGVFEEVRQGFS